MAEWILYAIFGALALGGALGVVFLANPVHSALSLVVTLVSIAVLFLEQSAFFLSTVQIIVYTGAIVVLFLFVIMMLGVDRGDERETRMLSRASFRYGFLAAVAVLLVPILLVTGGWPTGAPGTDTKAAITAAGGNVQAIAQSLFTQYLLPFEVTSILVVAAIVGVIVLAKRPKGLRGAGVGRSDAPGDDDGGDDSDGDRDTDYSASSGADASGAGNASVSRDAAGSSEAEPVASASAPASSSAKPASSASGSAATASTDSEKVV